MALETVISSGFASSGEGKSALVLMGGGARTAYQVGVLKTVSSILSKIGSKKRGGFPFKVLVGTSAGAINAASLAGYSELGLDAFAELERFWRSVRSRDVYRLNPTSANAWFGRLHRYLAALSLSRGLLAHGALLDNTPLISTLRSAVSFDGIDRALASNVLSSVAITASSYSSGVHWTFCHADEDSMTEPWNRPGRRAEFQPITTEHLMASSAIPIVFPAIALKVDGQKEYFGDGSMRQISPLSPAMHLGASKILVIGVGQPSRSGLGRHAVSQERPGLSAVAAHAMASVFHDTLQADIDQAMRATETLKELSGEVASTLRYRPLQVLAIQPSQSLDTLAHRHAGSLPPEIRQSLGQLLFGIGGASLASYLLFEPEFIDALIRLGEQDALARTSEILDFFSPTGQENKTRPPAAQSS
jgi:NTE family protein